MKGALKDVADVEREVPSGVILARIDPETGLAADTLNERGIFEYFRLELSPETERSRIEKKADSEDTRDLLKELF